MFPSSSILTLKIVLMSCGIISLAVAMKYTFIPLIIHFIASDFPTIWSAVLLMFKPPYLFLVLNGIIVIIAAISRFTQNQTESSPSSSVSPPGEILLPSVELPPPVVDKVVIPSEVWDVKMPVVVNGLDVGGGNYEEVGEEEEAENEQVVEAENEEVEEMPQEILPIMEKPSLLLTASAEQKQSIFRPEGRSKSTKVRVINHNRHQTLDSTWRMITEKRHTALTRQMKNSDTFRKSATFKDRTNFLHEPQVMSSGNLRKEPSLGKEELNRRVEGLIKKFNEEMRLQRRESLQRYMEMVNRGTN